MRIVHVTESYEPVGGLETFISSYTRSFVEAGHAVTVLTPPFPTTPMVEADLVLAHIGRPLGALYGMYLAQVLGVPAVAMLHGHTDYVRQLVRYLQPRHAVALSQRTHQVFPESTCILKGVDTELFAPRPHVVVDHDFICIGRRAACKHWERLPADQSGILCVSDCPHEETPAQYARCRALLDYAYDYEPHSYVELEAAAMGLHTPCGLTRDEVLRDYDLPIQTELLLHYLESVR